MGRRRRWGLLAAATAVAVGALAPLLPSRHAQSAPSITSGLPSGVPAAALKPEPALPAPAGWPFPESFPRTMGYGRLSAGAFYWTDFLYDDHGARGAQLQASSTPIAPAAGTYAYPPGPASGNGADIFRTGIGLDAQATYWRIDWTTLVDPSVPIALFALDTDDNATTGTAVWPAAAGIRSAGADRFLLLSERGAWLIGANGLRQSLETLGGALTVDRTARSFVVRVPRAALPASGVWRVRLAAGLANAAGDGFAPVGPNLGALPGEPPVYNVAFRADAQEPTRLNLWRDEQQAQALSLGGDVSQFSAPLDWSALADQRTTPEPMPKGYSNRWYVSSLDLGQGVVGESNNEYQGDLRPNFLGRVQPYSVYVPKSYDPAKPAPLTWHAFCEKRHSICVTTLGRGPDGWYYDEAEVDFWEVWHQLAATYTLDPDRTVLSGFSMGGWGTYKLGLTYPSLFAKAMPLAGPAICGIRIVPGADLYANGGRCKTEGNTTPLVENARWLPFVIHQGVVDELVPVASVIAQSQTFDNLGYRYRLQLYPTGDHLASSVEDPIYLGDEASQMGNGTRTQNPGHVTYAWYPHLARPEWGIGPNGAYWVQDVGAADGAPGKLARIDATSGARPEPAVTSTVQRGLDPAAAGSAYTERVWHEAATPPRQPTLTLQLTNVSGLTVDLAGAGFLPGEAGAAAVTSDAPTRLVLKGLTPTMGVSVDGDAPTAVTGGTGTAALAAGTHHVTFAPLPSAAASRRGASVLGSQLPATGAPETALAVGGLVLLLGALSLRRVLARVVVRR
ncbi:MAG: peptidase [Actinobacteria bacterium]|nr:MAG: peptidase [Actinomycetota bacterium]